MHLNWNSVSNFRVNRVHFLGIVQNSQMPYSLHLPKKKNIFCWNQLSICQYQHGCATAIHESWEALSKNYLHAEECVHKTWIISRLPDSRGAGAWGGASSLRSSHLQVHCLKSYSQVCHHGRELLKEAVVTLIPGNVCPKCSPLVIWNASLRNNITVHRLWVSYDIDFRDSFMNDVCLRWKHWKCRTCSFSLTQYSFSPMLV